MLKSRIIAIVAIALALFLTGCGQEESTICAIEDTACTVAIDDSPPVTTNQPVECAENSDCVAAECCHPTSCIPATEKKVCNVGCTMECKPGTMDCGYGQCECKSSKCVAVINGQ